MLSVPRKVRTASVHMSASLLLMGGLVAACLGAAHPAPLATATAQTQDANPAQVREKVLPPVEVFLEPLDGITPGEVVRFRVVVIPRVVPREVRITCRPAPEIEWVAGDTVAVLGGSIDRRDELDLAVRVPTSGFHPLHVVVELTAEDGTVWRRGVGTRLGPDDISRTARSVSGGEGGRSFIEYPAGPAKPEGGR
jgi:hypothetical protein